MRGGLAGLGLGLVVAVTCASVALGEGRSSRTARSRSCPSEMAQVEGFCIDRWEIHTVDHRSGRRLSPFYPPSPKLVRRVRVVWEVERHGFGDQASRLVPLPDLPPVERRTDFEPRAVSSPGVIPQGYLTYYLARQACANAGKRLCTEEEWVAACRGARQTKYPYGGQYVPGRCNVHRLMHPAFVLHGNSSVGHTDPRLNLIDESGRDPLLRLTGATPDCRSRWSGGDLYDMVGNLDEWVDDPSGVFVGGFYARFTEEGCDARIASHSPLYYDYSLGTRCCRDLPPAAQP